MSFNATLGACLIGGYFAAISYGLLCIQCLRFLRKYSKERRSLRYSVWLLWILGTLHAGFICHTLYITLVSNFGNRAIQTKIVWSTGTVAIITILTALLVQSWYCYRVWILSGQNQVLTCYLVTIIIVASALGMASSVQLFIHPDWRYFRTTHSLLFASLSLFAGGDLSIALTLCTFLYTQRSGLTRRAQSMLDTLMLWIINTGLLTSMVSLASIIACGADRTTPDSLIWSAFYYILAPMYSNSLLASLNARERFSKDNGMHSFHIASARFATSIDSSPHSPGLSAPAFPHAGQQHAELSVAIPQANTTESEMESAIHREYMEVKD